MAVGAPTTVKTGHAPKPMIAGRRRIPEHLSVWVFVTIPFLALAVAVPLMWGWGINGIDIALFFPFLLIGGLGITVGYHRYLTHRSFKAKRGLRIALTIAGALGIEGPPTVWVAAHRRHHQFSDAAGDPHSPWRYGESLRGLTKGFIYAHMGWMFERDRTNPARFAPDLLADRDIARVDRWYVALVVISVTAPAGLGAGWAALVGDAILPAALSAFFWAGLVRIAVLHHVTWSINSVCHIVGDQPFTSNDKAANFWPLAIISLGESWHNLHHADPTCARHGVLPGQIDISARVIWLLERAGWAYDVRWPRPERLAAKLR